MDRESGHGGGFSGRISSSAPAGANRALLHRAGAFVRAFRICHKAA
jgi:hypothetical protein